MIFEITHSGTAHSFNITADNPRVVNVFAPMPIVVTVALQRDGTNGTDGRDGRDGIDAVPAILDGGIIY